MSKKLIEIPACDVGMPPCGRTKGTETVRYWDGERTLELEACRAHAKALRNAHAVLAPFARFISGKALSGSPYALEGTPDGPTDAEVRAWAVAAGMKVAPRLSKAIREAYAEAHPAKPAE